MGTESKCKAALEAVKKTLSKKEYSNCYEYISVHREWLLGLEFAIDYLAEEERTVSNKSYELFRDAFIAMEEERNSRLEHLKLLVGED